MRRARHSHQDLRGEESFERRSIYSDQQLLADALLAERKTEPPQVTDIDPLFNRDHPQNSYFLMEVQMIGMDVVSFAILLVISLGVSAVLHFGLSYRVLPGWGSYFSKVVLGWIGGWVGSPVLGHWWEPLSYQQIYVIPAILGCAGLIVLAVDFFQTASARKSP